MEKRRVLFVDDDEVMLRSLERGLFDEPYETRFAKSGDEAIEILRREEVHVIVTDMCMPAMGGLELLKTVKGMYPRIVNIVLSGFAPSDDLTSPEYQVEIFRFICKSQKLEEHLKPAIRQAIDSYNLRSKRESMPAQSGRGSDR
jgi:DNA-binding NtrC family response regulator